MWAPLIRMILFNHHKFAAGALSDRVCRNRPQAIFIPFVKDKGIVKSKKIKYSNHGIVQQDKNNNDNSTTSHNPNTHSH
jgi:hypothetical protein